MSWVSPLATTVCTANTLGLSFNFVAFSRPSGEWSPEPPMGSGMSLGHIDSVDRIRFETDYTP